jgi:hypothetical protein
MGVGAAEILSGVQLPVQRLPGGAASHPASWRRRTGRCELIGELKVHLRLSPRTKSFWRPPFCAVTVTGSRKGRPWDPHALSPPVHSNNSNKEKLSNI